MDAALVSQFVGSRRVQRFVVGDTAGLDAGETEAGASVGVPITFADGRVYGILSCLRAAPHSVTERDVRFLHLLAAIAATELERHDREAARRRARLRRVRDVTRERRLSIVFQPIVDLADLDVVGFEALTRFRGRPHRGPEWWYAEAEAVGLRTGLELLAARAAMNHLTDLPPGTYLAINASPTTVMAGSFAESIQRCCPGSLVLELTEHAAIEDYEAIAKPLGRIREMGVRLAIDDAGAGFATFKHILRLAPDIIKLDMTLIRHIQQNPTQRALVASLVSFADRVGADLTAEGIESQAQLSVLRDLGVPFGQGYLLGMPDAEPSVSARASVG